MQRLRITFAKHGALRFIGNLDLHRAWERILRRAGAALVYSQGFHPTPKIQLASALPLGITSGAELLDIWLYEPIDPDEFLRDVSAVLPSGIEVCNVTAVGLTERSLQSRLCAAEYIVEGLDDFPADVLEGQVAAIIGRADIIRKRRGKDYDLRPLIEFLGVEIGEKDIVTLRMRLSARPGLTGRPEEVLAAMGVYSERVHRTALFFVDKPD